ncbi:MAG: helix-hairpin-helix domain-containing protein [Marinilabilia sp.]
MTFRRVRFAVISLVGFLSFGLSFAQSGDEIREWADEVADMYAGDMETEDLSLLLEELTSLARNPLNINTANREHLESIFFLSDIQVENILYRRYVSGPFHSIYELQTVEGLPVTTIQMLEPVIYFGEARNEKIPFKVWGDWFLRSEYQLEKARGFKSVEDENAPFAGDPFKLYSRTSLNTNKGFSGGFIAEKDPGEPLFEKETKGLDLMSGYLHYEDREGWLREAGGGQYQMSAGQGLVMQSGMPLRKSSLTTSIRNRQSSFRPSLTSSGSSGMLGAYLTLGVGEFEVSPFFSLKRRDGRIQGDSCLTALREDGFHRTSKEREQRDNARERIAGIKGRYSGRLLDIEAGHVQYRIDPPLCPSERAYNRFSFRGHEARNSWLSYILSKKGLLVFGELAFDGLNRPALWNGLVWEGVPGFSLALGHRDIPLEYHSPLAGPMTESSSFSGETGIYAGIEWEWPFDMVWSSYIDRYRFRWLKYGLDGPAEGFDWLGQIEKHFKQKSRLRVRYRHREKPANYGTAGGSEDLIRHDTFDQLKVQYRHEISPGWQFTTLGQWHFVKAESGKESGCMLAQDIKWNGCNEKLTLTGRYALFSSSDYKARLYAYEPHVLYMFSVPAYIGKGDRYLLLCNYKFRKYLHLWLRVARWHYNDRSTVGSGYNEVDSNQKTRLTFQLRFKF